MTSKPHQGLPPVSYEALAENNRHTHANLDACIEQRQRLEEQLALLREVALPFKYPAEATFGDHKRLREVLGD